jgi:hypothetical protein
VTTSPSTGCEIIVRGVRTTFHWNFRSCIQEPYLFCRTAHFLPCLSCMFLTHVVTSPTVTLLPLVSLHVRLTVGAVYDRAFVGTIRR